MRGEKKRSYNSVITDMYIIFADFINFMHFTTFAFCNIHTIVVLDLFLSYNTFELRGCAQMSGSFTLHFYLLYVVGFILHLKDSSEDT